MKSLSILNTIDVETELFRQGTSGDYVLLRTDPIPRRVTCLRVLLRIRTSVIPLAQTRFVLKPADVNEEGLILLRLPKGLPLALAELRLCADHVRGPAHLIKVVPNRKEASWKSRFLQS